MEEYTATLLQESERWPAAAALSMADADTFLKEIADKSFAALPGKRLSNVKTYRYKDGWSSCLVAMEGEH